MTPPKATDFCWNEARGQLAGLPGGAINIGFEAADRHVAEGRGDHVALRCLGKRYERRDVSFAELAEQSSRVAAVLKSLGLAAGESVAVLLERGPDLYFAALGAWKAGGVFCPLFTAFGPGPLKARVELSRAKVLIASATLYQRKLAALRDSLPQLQHVLLVPDAEILAGCEDLHALAAKADPKDGAALATAPEAPAFVHFTSGTTGTPKGAVHPHRVVVSHLMTGRQVFSLTAADVYWCTADPGWITNTAYAIVAPLVNGCTSLVDAHDTDPRRWYGILKDENVTVWYTTPTAIRMMMRFGAALARTYRENSLRLAASVGEPLNPEAVAWGEKALGMPFLDTWWQTETGAIAIANMPGEAKYGSMGKPLPGVEAAVVTRDLSSVKPVTDADAVGELALKADLPSLFGGYLGDSDRTEAAFADGWYLTGDLVRRDADGFFWFVGRSDDMIKSSAHTIGPFEIECALMDHPAVAEIGVVGKPDLLVREVPVAFVSLNPGFEAGDALQAELLAYARQQLGAAMAPREVHFIDSMPKTTTGKILRRALKSKAVGEPDEAEPRALGAVPGRYDDE
ncbi:MAG TPA: AMP-binding protein [Candidatus Omnitrophota bacterium]|nr:AMP-binding protein [Candidatus Omnitrophota bacterium]